MNVTKLKIAKSIKNESNLSLSNCILITDKFFNILKEKIKTQNVKISSFGTFSTFVTKERVGRNPKTKEEFEIKPIKKIRFQPSKNIKKGALNWTTLLKIYFFSYSFLFHF